MTEQDERKGGSKMKARPDGMDNDDVEVEEVEVPRPERWRNFRAHGTTATATVRQQMEDGLMRCDAVQRRR